MKEKKLLFEVDGFKVYDNTNYTVRDKIDYDAPSGYVERGVSRLPSDGVGDTFTCGFSSIDEMSSEGVWNTGFYPSSKCYNNIQSDKAIASLVKLAVENVKKPYQKRLGLPDDTKLSQEGSNTYWDNKTFKVYSGQVMNTRKIEDRVNLYFALLTGHLTPEEHKGNSSYSKSTYIVIDIDKGIKRKDEKARDKFEAIYSFMDMVKTDKKRVISVLDYIGLSMSDTAEVSTMMSMFEEFIEKDESKLKLYNSTMDETDTPKGREKIEIYTKLKSRFPTKGVSKSANGVYFFNGEEIGGDLKTAAANISSQKHFSDIKKELLIGDQD